MTRQGYIAIFLQNHWIQRNIGTSV